MRATEGNRPADRPPRGRRRGGLASAARAALAEAGVPAGAMVVAAVSGGPDSTALLAVLADLRVEGRLRLEACIVDHGIREQGQIDADILFVGNLCASLDIPLHVARLEPGECRRLARAARRSLEDVARDVRLRELASRARELHAGAVALGHTQDDSFETILMGIVRGSDAAGLRGIALSRGLFVRPLLRCSRAEVLAFLREKGLGFRTDPTNADPAILRNRVRAGLLPVLERDFPGYRAGLMMLSRKNAMVVDLLQSMAAAVPWRRTGRGFSLPTEAFFALPAAVRSFSLMTLWDELRAGGSPRRLPFRFLLPALSPQARREKCAPLARRGTILKGHGVCLRVAGGTVVWEADIVSGGKKSYLMEANRTGRFVIRSAGITVDIMRLPRSGRGNDQPQPDAEVLVCDIVPPIVLRSRRAGDGLLLEQGTKTLKALFTEWKVPGEDRWKVPVLADRRGVLAVLGRPVDRRTLVRRGAAVRNTADAALGIRAEWQGRDE